MVSVRPYKCQRCYDIDKGYEDASTSLTRHHRTNVAFQCMLKLEHNLYSMHLLNSNNPKSPIRNVCSRCGILANHYTCLERFWWPAKKPCFDISTYHKWVCPICWKDTLLTEVRDFFYPDFSLIPLRVRNKLQSEQ